MDSALTEEFYEHCLGSGDPSDEIFSNGKIDEEWITEFNRLYSLVYSKWIHREMLPQKVVASLYHIGSICMTRYELWVRNAGAPEKTTVQALNELSHSCMLLLMNGKEKG